LPTIVENVEKPEMQKKYEMYTPEIKGQAPQDKLKSVFNTVIKPHATAVSVYKENNQSSTNFLQKNMRIVKNVLSDKSRIQSCKYFNSLSVAF